MTDGQDPGVQVIEADRTWVNGSFVSGARVAIDRDGRISAVGTLEDEPTLRLRGKALLPGMVNAHSHAFQRGLRGRGEMFPKGAGSFWTWREAMYELVDRMDQPRMYRLSRQAFEEMLRAGVTTVGEFHYLHHDAGEEGFAFDEVVLRAAADAGIRIALLNTYYRTGGINRELAGGQRRFRCRSTDEYWQQMDRLSGVIDPQTQSLGVVAHSIRAVPMDDFVALHKEADRRGMVFHAHVEEQQAEISACIDAYHKPPMALLTEALDISPRFTAVHCTHTAAADLDTFVEAGGNVCLCPLTEANLGDGLANVPRMLNNGGHVCLGTDSNARICFTEEMRWMEYGQRLVTQSRGVCRDELGRTAQRLWTSATVSGARSLGLRTGTIEPGSWADFTAIDLESPALSGWDDQSLLAAFVLGSGNEAIDRVCVGGRWIEF